MSDFTWLKYVDNPYTVIAVITAVSGVAFRMQLKHLQKSRPVLILVSYGMFLFAALALAVSVVAISFLMQGRGATDIVSHHWMPSFSLVETAHAHEYDGETVGWVWYGEKVEDGVVSHNFDETELPTVSKVIVTTEDVNLRNTPPQFSWWRLRYVLGDLIMKLHKGEKLEILNVYPTGKQLWVVVRVIPE